jgi:hypothetical protein
MSGRTLATLPVGATAALARVDNACGEQRRHAHKDDRDHEQRRLPRDSDSTPELVRKGTDSLLSV